MACRWIWSRCEPPSDKHLYAAQHLVGKRWKSGYNLCPVSDLLYIYETAVFTEIFKSAKTSPGFQVDINLPPPTPGMRSPSIASSRRSGRWSSSTRIELPPVFRESSKVLCGDDSIIPPLYLDFDMKELKRHESPVPSIRLRHLRSTQSDVLRRENSNLSSQSATLESMHLTPIAGISETMVRVYPHSTIRSGEGRQKSNESRNAKGLRNQTRHRGAVARGDRSPSHDHLHHTTQGFLPTVAWNHHNGAPTQALIESGVGLSQPLNSAARSRPTAGSGGETSTSSTSSVFAPRSTPRGPHPANPSGGSIPPQAIKSALKKDRCSSSSSSSGSVPRGGKTSGRVVLTGAIDIDAVKSGGTTSGIQKRRRGNPQSFWDVPRDSWSQCTDDERVCYVGPATETARTSVLDTARDSSKISRKVADNSTVYALTNVNQPPKKTNR